MDSKSFTAQEYNYDCLASVAAHVIGHRTIEINNIETNNDNLIGEIENYGKYTLGSVSAVGLHFGTSGCHDTVDTVCDLSLSGTGVGNTDQVVLNSDSTETEFNNTRQLVVISVRGSVSILDWIMNLYTQLHICLFDFETGRDNVPEF